MRERLCGPGCRGGWKEDWETPLTEEKETLVHFAFVSIKTLLSTNICFPTLNPTAEEL